MPAEINAPAELSALTEIEYRAWYLEQEIRDGRRTPKAAVLDELAGIQAAVERERKYQGAIAERISSTNEKLGGLEEATRRLRPYLDERDGRRAGGPRGHLRVLPTPDEGGESDA